VSRWSLLVFDFDGTLADSEGVIVDTMQRAFTELGHEPPTPAAIRAGIGIELGAMVERLIEGMGGGPPAGEVRDRYRTIWLEEAHARIELFPEVPALLERLAARGHELTIATGKSKAGLERSLVHHGIADRFSTWATPDQVARGKPWPDLVELLLRERGHARDEALVIGDSTLDVEMARAARVRCCAVTWGTCDREALQALSPDHLVDSFAELEKLL